MHFKFILKFENYRINVYDLGACFRMSIYGMASYRYL